MIFNRIISLGSSIMLFIMAFREWSSQIIFNKLNFWHTSYNGYAIAFLLGATVSFLVFLISMKYTNWAYKVSIYLNIILILVSFKFILDTPEGLQVEFSRLVFLGISILSPLLFFTGVIVYFLKNSTKPSYINDKK